MLMPVKRNSFTHLRVLLVVTDRASFTCFEIPCNFRAKLTTSLCVISEQSQGASVPDGTPGLRAVPPLPRAAPGGGGDRGGVHADISAQTPHGRRLRRQIPPQTLNPKP
jgi:hypothetical protein